MNGAAMDSHFRKVEIELDVVSGRIKEKVKVNGRVLKACRW